MAFLALLIFIVLLAYISILLVFLHKLKITLVKKSLGYIKSVEYSSVSFFPYKFSIRIAGGDGVYEVKIKNIYVKMMGFLKFGISLPKKIDIMTDKNIELHFSHKPIFTLHPPAISLQQTPNLLSLKCKDCDIDSILLKELHLQNPNKHANKTHIILDATYMMQGNSHNKIYLDFTIDYGFSIRTKSKYMKSIRFNQTSLAFDNAIIMIDGKVNYNFMDFPSGELNMEITNYPALQEGVINKLSPYMNRAITQFLELHAKLQDIDQKNLSLRYNFTKDGVAINNIPLSEITQSDMTQADSAQLNTTNHY